MNKEDQYKAEKIAFITGFGNWIGDIILYPLDTISTRLKGNKHIYHNPFTFIKNTVKKDGLNLYRGFSLTFAASFVPTAIYIYAYEKGMRLVQSTLQKYYPDSQHKKYARLYFPFFVSLIAQFICLIPYLPVDTVRTRIQMNLPEYQYSSFFSALKQIYRKEGFTRLYMSGRIYILAKTVYAGIQFQLFEVIRYFAGPDYYWLLFNTIISTAIATTVLNPLQVLLTRYALIDTTKRKKEVTIFSVGQKLYKRQGLTGFYKGYATQLISHCTYALFWLPLYQFFRQKYNVQLQ